MKHDWLRDIANDFGVVGALRQLGGEYDLNFRGRTAQGDVIVKAMRPSGEPALVDQQCAAISHALAADPTLPLPRLLPAEGKRFWQNVADTEGRQRMVWVQRAFEGIPMGEIGRAHV